MTLIHTKIGLKAISIAVQVRTAIQLKLYKNKRYKKEGEKEDDKLKH